MAENVPTGNKANGKRKQADEPVPYSSIATHPRASMQVRRAKGWGGLIGFAAAAVLSLMASVPFTQAAERALLFGIGGYLLMWGLSLMVWRQWMIAEQRAAIAEIQSRREQLAAEQAAAKQPAGKQPGGKKAVAGA